MGVVHYNHTHQSTPLIIESGAHGSPALRRDYQVGTLRGCPGTKFSHAQTVSSVPSIDSPYLLFNLQLRVNLIIVNMRKNAQVPCGYHCRGGSQIPEMMRLQLM